MEKIGLCRCNGKPIITRVEYEEAVLKVNEIVKWINEHEKYVQPLEKAWKQAVEEALEQAKEKRPGAHSMTLPKGSRSHDHSKILRYKLSNDKVGLVAYLAGGNSYHIHSDELTPNQLLIKNQLLEMEGK